MKHFSVGTLVALILILGFGAGVAHAAPVTGWAWSSNIGWVQFDTGVSQPVTVDTATGNWAGYAWSSNIGWIDFNSNSCGARPNVVLSTGAVTGWAKALSANGNGWDGCIELSGVNHTSPNMTGTRGVTMIPTTGAFIGFAWGGPVVGWLQFNGLGGGGTGGPGSNPNDPACPGCIGGGSAPVIAGSCTALTPTTNLAPNTPVTYKITPGSGSAPYLYSWEGQASTSADTYVKSFTATSPNGPVVRVGDSASPVKGYSTPLLCPGVTVIAPLGASNLHINTGTAPSVPTFSSINVNQNTLASFNISWDITLPDDYSCTASIVNDPNIAFWNSGWKTRVLDASNSSTTGQGYYTWRGHTGASLFTNASMGLGIGAYQFRFVCTGGVMGTQTTSVTLRVTSTSENEI